MSRFFKTLTFGFCALVSLSAQAPSPDASTAPAKPLRHLEFAFSVSEQGVVGYDFNAISGDTEKASGAGNASTGNGGTMYADILSLAPDGSLVIKISEQMKNEASVRQPFTCNVYGNTAVLCPSVPAPSAAQWVLLSFLGREFIDGAPWTADGHWQRKQSSSQFTTEEDFTLVNAGDGKKVVVSETKKVDTHDGSSTQTSNITVNYDRAMEVPDVIRDEVVYSGGSSAGHARYEFRLTRDSMAKP